MRSSYWMILIFIGCLVAVSFEGSSYAKNLQSSTSINTPSQNVDPNVKHESFLRSEKKEQRKEVLMITNEEIKVILVIALYISFFAIYWIIILSLRRSSWLPISRVNISLQDSPSVLNLILWARNLSVSLDHFKNTYEWRINQWSKFSDAILTATLAFVSTFIISIFKNEIDLQKLNDIYVISAGLVASILIYLLSQQRIVRLRREFNALFEMLSLLNRR